MALPSDTHLPNNPQGRTSRSPSPRASILGIPGVAHTSHPKHILLPSPPVTHVPFPRESLSLPHPVINPQHPSTPFCLRSHGPVSDLSHEAGRQSLLPPPTNTYSSATPSVQHREARQTLQLHKIYFNVFLIFFQKGSHRKSRFRKVCDFSSHSFRTSLESLGGAQERAMGG